VLTILYLPNGLIGVPAWIRQRRAAQAKRQEAKKLASVPS
jgi:hypothetical protein